MTQALASARSLLFAPGNDGRKLARASGSGADGVVADLEDAVLPQNKDTARRAVLDWLRTAPAGPLRVVRVNGLDTAWGEADLAALSDARVDAIMLPKATADVIGSLPEGGAPVVALIETAAGLRRAYDVAMHQRVHALALGGADLGAELRWYPRSDGLELLHARSVLVLDSAAAGLRAPFDVVHLATRHEDSLRAEAGVARSLGLGGKLCIHPAQLDVVHEVFSPSPAEVEHARQVVEALDRATADGSGVAVVAGRLVDLPVARRARTTLRLADRPTATDT
jgi:citrate lyase beta subunit